MVLDDRTSDVAGMAAVRRNGKDCVVPDLEAYTLRSERDSSDGGCPLADPLDMLADDLDIEAHGALHVAENGMIGNAQRLLQFGLRPR